ncbi:hypothetical protein ACFQ0M_00350 [Kitasatospora aburaviensis]
MSGTGAAHPPGRNPHHPRPGNRRHRHRPHRPDRLKALAPLRRRLGIQPTYSLVPEAGPAPTLEQLAADAAHRAATGAHALDRSSGSLTQATNWVGAADGTATCGLPGGAHLRCVPSPPTTDTAAAPISS